MRVSREATTGSAGAERQVRGFIARFGPAHQLLIRSVRKALCKRFPSANELVYDYSLFFVIGYSPTERGIDSVYSIAAGADGVRLYFSHRVRLPDPKKILLGSGKQTRFIWIESPGTLKRPEVQALVQATIDRAKVPFPRSGRGKLIVKSTSAKRRAEPKSKR